MYVPLRITSTVLLTFAVLGSACGRSSSLTGLDGSLARAGAGSPSLAEQGDVAPDPATGRGPGNAPPRVEITSPQPNPFINPTLQPNATIQWAGEDPDGPGPGIKSYRYRIFRENDPEFPFEYVILEPDSIRRRYAPRFEGWTEVNGRVDSATLPDLPNSGPFMFVITAIDRRGNYDPVFLQRKNMLYFLLTSGTPENSSAEGEETAPRGGVSRHR